MSSPIPRAAIDAATPTSRSTFRLLAGCVDATNRDADTMRHALLAQWTGHGGPHELERRIRRLDQADPDGALGVDARLAIWFHFNDPGDGRLVAEDDPLLIELSEGLRNRLTGMARPTQD